MVRNSLIQLCHSWVSPSLALTSTFTLTSSSSSSSRVIADRIINSFGKYLDECRWSREMLALGGIFVYVQELFVKRSKQINNLPLSSSVLPATKCTKRVCSIELWAIEEGHLSGVLKIGKISREKDFPARQESCCCCWAGKVVAFLVDARY